MDLHFFIVESIYFIFLPSLILYKFFFSLFADTPCDPLHMIDLYGIPTYTNWTLSTDEVYNCSTSSNEVTDIGIPTSTNQAYLAKMTPTQTLI